jgi:tellurite resistance protein TerC
LPAGAPRESLAAVSTSIWFWIAFHIGVFVAIGVDLVTFRRRNRELSMRAAARRTILWVLVSLGFNLLVLRIKGSDDALDFLTAYLVEYSLSADNIFVFVLIFNYFEVPRQAQHRALVWGVLGALIMRGTMILGGIVLVRQFHFVLYFFGGLLLLNAFRMLFGKAMQRDFGQSWLVRIPMRLFLITPEFHGEHFKARVGGQWMLTRLAFAMLVIEMSDLLFAIDSIPAVFAITRDPFIAYTSNICAILGLRSLYFLLANLMDRFLYLRTGLGVILGFIGLKMILSDIYPVPTILSLGLILFVLAAAIGLSILVTHRRKSSG